MMVSPSTAKQCRNSSATKPKPERITQELYQGDLLSLLLYNSLGTNVGSLTQTVDWAGLNFCLRTHILAMQRCRKLDVF
jgi:hypothetical protein